MAKRRIALAQPLVRANDRNGHPTGAEQQVDWSRRGRLASFAMTVAALIYVAHYPHDSVEVVQGAARYLVAWLLLASGIAIISYPATQRIDRWVDRLCIGLAACLTLALVTQVGNVNLRLGINELGWWWATAAIIPLARRVAADDKAAWWLFRIALAVTIAQAVIGWHQQLIDLPDLIAQYRENPDKTLRTLNIPVDQLSATRVRFENRLFDGGPTGTFALTNSLAASLCGGMVAILACMLRGSKLWHWRWIVWTAAIAVVTTILLATASRSAIAALLIAGSLFAGQRLFRSLGIAWMTRRPLALVSLGAGMVGALAIGLYGFRASEFVGQAPASLAIRINYWRACIDMLAQHPWSGIGPGQFKLIYEQFRMPESNEQIADPHQFLLQVAAAGGLPALVLFTALLCLLIWLAISVKGQAPQVSIANPETTAIAASTERSNAMDMIAWTSIGLTIGMAWLGGLATGQLPSIQALLTGTLAGIAFSSLVWCGLKQISDEAENDSSWYRQAAAWASVAIFVDLLASGGISVPGISVALWCWVGIAVPARWNAHEVHQQSEATGELSMASQVSSAHVKEASTSHVTACWFNRAVPSIFVAGLVAWYFIGVRPVESANLAHSRFLNQAERRLTPTAAESLEACLAADPWNAEFALELAAVYQQLGASSPENAQKWDRLWQEAEQRAVALAGQDAGALMQLGDQRLERFQRTGDPTMLQSANQWYEQATLRSPAHETCLAQWAETLRALGDPRAKEVALRALKLSEAGGYYERSLPFTIIRPAVQLSPLPSMGRAVERSKSRPLQPADEVLAPLLPPK